MDVPLKARSQTSRANADELSILSMSSEQKIPALFKIKQAIARSLVLPFLLCAEWSYGANHDIPAITVPEESEF